MLHTKKHFPLMKVATTFHENPSCRMWHFDPCLTNLCSFSTGRHCDFAVHIHVFPFKRNPFSTNQVQRAKNNWNIFSATYRFQEKCSGISWTLLLCFLRSKKIGSSTSLPQYMLTSSSILLLLIFCSSCMHQWSISNDQLLGLDQ